MSDDTEKFREDCMALLHGATAGCDREVAGDEVGAAAVRIFDVDPTLQRFGAVVYLELLKRQRARLLAKMALLSASHGGVH